MTAIWGKISSKEIVAAVKGHMVSGDPQACFSGFNSDSRTVQRGELFWALKGDRFDGHDFTSRAVMKGASGMVVQKGFLTSLKDVPPIAVIAVDDTLRALGDLAAWWRRQHVAKVAAITGSSGKTTAKEMTAAILQVGNKTLKNPGNHNNLIGLPVTLLKLEKTHQRAVLEMGMNHKGEIARLTEISNPEVAVILNVGMAHLEGLGNINGVAEAKTEMMGKLSPEAKIILNGDDEILMKHAARFAGRGTMHRALTTGHDASCPYITFGLEKKNRIRGINIKNCGIDGMRFDLACDGNRWPIALGVSGVHNVKNALAAAAIGLSLDEPMGHIVKGLGSFSGIQGRFQSIPLQKEILLIDDTYNANPSALKAALHSAAPMVKKGGRFFVGLGDMLELGEAAPSAHREAGRRIADSGASWLFTMGIHAKDVKEGAIAAGMPSNRVIISKTHDELTTKIIQEIKFKDLVFLKGSRMMQFEKVSEGLQRHFGLQFTDL
jgi:UDP-N-acetylmuramoyl-tripeptide--D-alanyl-D-alanine ligase